MIIYEVLYTQCLRYNIFSTWFLDIRISTCCKLNFEGLLDYHCYATLQQDFEELIFEAVEITKSEIYYLKIFLYMV